MGGARVISYSENSHGCDTVHSAAETTEIDFV